MKQHNSGFIKIAEEARKMIEEISIDEVNQWMQEKRKFHLVDVREDNEWDAGFIPNAKHIGKGVIERDIETTIPEKNESIVLYCGGGYRSAIAAKALQDMGYQKVLSMAGGFRGWQQSGFPIAQEK